MCVKFLFRIFCMPSANLERKKLQSSWFGSCYSSDQHDNQMAYSNANNDHKNEKHDTKCKCKRWMILTSWFAFVLKMTNIHIKKVLMDEKWSHEKHKTNEVFETLNFLHVQAFYFDGMFASQVNTNNVFDTKCWPSFSMFREML